MSLTALDNVAMIETMLSGKLVTSPSPAARSFYGKTIGAAFTNPARASTLFPNAWLPWSEEFSVARRWESYTDKITKRQYEYGANTVMLDFSDVPGSVQNNPNDPQNELRLARYREDYRQAHLQLNRDEFTPITVDRLEIARLFREGGPDGTNVSAHMARQITQAENRDDSAEFQTVMLSIAGMAGTPNVYNLQLPSLLPGSGPAGANPTDDDARSAAASLRTQILALADFVPWFAPWKGTQTLPKSQVRLLVRQSWMTRLGTLAYATSFNPEYVFALPQDQISEVPDHYFDRHPALSTQQALLLDSGNDQDHGSVVVKDSFYGWDTDQFPQKNSENRSLHHASIIGIDGFKTFITCGAAASTSVTLTSIVPATISGVLYGPLGDIASSGGSVIRGQQYSTRVAVLDAAGFPAGGWSVTLSGNQSVHSRVGDYNTVVIGNDEAATSVSVTFTSLIDATKTVTQSYTVTGAAVAYDGSGLIILGETFSFAPGSGSGGTLTYTAATGASYTGSLDGGTTWTTLGASPLAVAHSAILRVRSTAATGFTHTDGTTVKTYGPYTAA